LCGAAVKSIHTDSGTVELSHDKAVFLDKITNGFFLVENPLEPLMLVHVALYDLFLSLKDVAEVFTRIERSSIRPLLKSVKL